MQQQSPPCVAGFVLIHKLCYLGYGVSLSTKSSVGVVVETVRFAFDHVL